VRDRLVLNVRGVVEGEVLEGMLVEGVGDLAWPAFEVALPEEESLYVFLGRRHGKEGQ